MVRTAINYYNISIKGGTIMEEVKEKLLMVIVFVIVIAICIAIFYFLFLQSHICYTKIDNTKIQELSATDDMRYEYTLIAYDKNGGEKEVTFKTSRELKEGAYLELQTMIARGVIDWREVAYQELPEKVQEHYQ